MTVSALELAASGAEAVEKARGFQPAAILLDFILPDMRGTEVCRRLAADPETAGIPVVLISAKGAEIRQAYQDVGNVVGYIAKPFTPEAIIEVLRDVVARARDGSLAALKSGVGEIADVAAVAQTNGHEAAVPDAMVPTDEVAVAAPNGSAEPVPAIAAPLAASWDQPPANGAAPHSGGASDAWDEGDEAGLDEETPAPTIADLDVDLSDLLWSFAPPARPRPADLAQVPAVTPESTAMAKELKRRGFRFVGPTTAYALMQATGMVDDHLVSCWVPAAV